MLALVLLAGVGRAGAQSPASDLPAGSDPAFQAAVEAFRQGRMSAAYGRFTALAQRGDADAARIALFMHRYGPTLYGRYWDVGLDDMRDWTQSSCGPGGRMPPVYRPALERVGQTKATR